MEKIAEKISHAPAIAFQIKERGFIEEGYWADFMTPKWANVYCLTVKNRFEHSFGRIMLSSSLKSEKFAPEL